MKKRVIKTAKNPNGVYKRRIKRVQLAVYKATSLSAALSQALKQKVRGLARKNVKAITMTTMTARYSTAYNKRKAARRPYRFILPLALFTLSVQRTLAQADGDAGITEATSLIKGYFNTGVNLMYAIGAVVGLIGAIKVYNKWSAGEPDTTKVASSWFGACIFLVVVATVLKSFFSV